MERSNASAKSLSAILSSSFVAMIVLGAPAYPQSQGESISAPARTTTPVILPVKPRRASPTVRVTSQRDESGESIRLNAYPSLRVKLAVFAIQTIAQGLAKSWKDDSDQIDQPVARNRPVLKRATERAQYRSPNEILRSARTLFVRSRSGFFESEVFEREILKRSEKEKLELVITRDASEADLVVEVYRKKFSTRFVFSVIEPGTKRVLISDKSSSLGGDIEPDLANLLIKRFKAARE